jgi:peptidoglycan/xylan/chitin deacetylase (PgdA/CDA1 family)
MFHRFHKSDKIPTSQGSINEIEFDLILQNVGIENILSPDEWLKKLKSETLKSNHLCVTFDDGLKSQYEVALPILDKYDLKAFWFVFSSVFHGQVDNNEVFNIFITSFFDSFEDFFYEFVKVSLVSNEVFESADFLTFYKSMNSIFPFYSEEDIKFRFLRNYFFSESVYTEIMNKIIIFKGVEITDLSRNVWMNNDDLAQLDYEGHNIGLHSYSHPFLISKLSIEDQKTEYSLNNEHINSITNKSVAAMSHPLNSYSIDTISILEELGVYCGFRSNMVVDQKSELLGASDLEIPREDSSNLKAMLKL